MKYIGNIGLKPVGQVTPFAGVWIEIKAFRGNWIAGRVTPFAGVWIEIRNCFHLGQSM